LESNFILFHIIARNRSPIITKLHFDSKAQFIDAYLGLVCFVTGPITIKVIKDGQPRYSNLPINGVNLAQAKEAFNNDPVGFIASLDGSITYDVSDIANLKSFVTIVAEDGAISPAVNVGASFARGDEGADIFTRIYTV
jgi:hypothetical protein